MEGFLAMFRICKSALRIAAMAWIAASLTACKTHTITNLTPGRQPRNDAGVYHFEVDWGSRQQSIRTNSIKPMVVIGNEVFPMQKTPVVSSRWEAFIPVAATNKEVYYRYKFDYEYKAIPAVRNDSKLSPPYTLIITDK